MPKKRTKRLPTYATRNEALLDTMKLLTVLPSFRERVRDLRQQLSIPEKGLPYEDTEGSRRANLKFSRSLSSDKFLESVYYKNKRQKLEDSQHKKEITAEELDLKHDELIREAPINILHYGIKGMLKKYQLTPNYHASLRSYILHGQIIAPTVNYGIVTMPDKDGFMEVYIKITGLTTKEEREEAFKEAEDHFLFHYSNLIKKFKPYKNIDRDIALFNEWKNRLSLGLRTSKDVASFHWSDIEKLSDEELKTYDKKNALIVRQSLHRLKEAIRLRFPNETL